MLIWKKRVGAKAEPQWVERLGFVDPTRLVVRSAAGSDSVWMEVYAPSKKEAALLLKEFGGSLGNSKTEVPRERPPIRIRKQLVIVSSERQRVRLQKELPGRKALLVPAEMAFGTGDHATTSSCLRLLCDLGLKLGNTKWRMLDLGTGSGILAIAARHLGATAVEAYDFDPASVRIASANVAANGVDRIKVARADVLDWQPKRQWDLVAANLFSEVLIKAAPAIAAATRRGGWLILSGILRTQEKECLKAFSSRFGIERLVHRGKWTSVLGRRR